MPYHFYLFLHFAGLLMMMGSIIGALIYGRLKPGKEKTTERTLLMMTHGIGLLALLIAGFGLLARLKLGFPLWVVVKLGIWLALGFIISPAIKGKYNVVLLYSITIALVFVAVYLGVYKELF